MSCRAADATTPEAPAFLAWVTRLVHEHRARLARTARAEGLGPEDAFDAVQEAFHSFLTLPQAKRLVDEPDQSRKLLIVLTRNVARNRRRLHAVARPHASDTQVVQALPAAGRSVEEMVESAEQQLRLAGCLATLADIQRSVVTLRMLDEIPGEDVARTLGITAKTAGTHIERIYTKTGASTRSTATLFAMQHGLLDSLSPLEL
jgi:RNA polymerase sigma-70 factor (ECF subfamily)